MSYTDNVIYLALTFYDIYRSFCVPIVGSSANSNALSFSDAKCHAMNSDLEMEIFYFINQLINFWRKFYSTYFYVSCYQLSATSFSPLVFFKVILERKMIFHVRKNLIVWTKLVYFFHSENSLGKNKIFGLQFAFCEPIGCTDAHSLK